VESGTGKEMKKKRRLCGQNHVRCSAVESCGKEVKHWIHFKVLTHTGSITEL
jgi:hypothetical protein